MKEKDVKSAQAMRKVSRVKKKPAEHGDFLTAPSYGEPVKAKAPIPGSLGQRIKKARQSRGLTLKDICSRTGIEIETLELIEVDEIAPPLGLLIKLGKALDMKMGYFISPGVDKPMTVVRKDQRTPVARHGEKKSAQYGYVYESLAPDKANRKMEPFIVTLLPSKADAFSIHDGQEFIFVLDGEIKVQLGDCVELLRVGDAVYYDSKQPHMVKASGDRKAIILAVIYAESR